MQEEMEKRLQYLTKEILKVAFVSIVTALLCIRCFDGKNEPQSNIITKTDTLIVKDTIIDFRPISIGSTIKDTIWLSHTDTIHIKDTIRIPIPIEQKTYKTDAYCAIVSGFKPTLESIEIYQKTSQITIQQDRIVNKKYCFGATIGPGVLITPNGNVQAGVGATVGITIRF